jgi:hypothetical protein
MRSVSATDVSLDRHETEWATLCAHHHNVLLEGSAAATNAALLLLLPHLRQPVAWSRPDAPIQLPHRAAGAFILRNVAALSAGDQARLLEWSGTQGSGTQIVSTTEGRLFALVARGLFDAALYYRLNTMLLQVAANAPARDAAAERHARRSVAVPAAERLSAEA